MDVKFRKLISRLSIKERMKPEKTQCMHFEGNCTANNRVGTTTTVTVNIDFHKNLSGGGGDSTKSTSTDLSGNKSPEKDDGNPNRLILIPHPIDYWPESNILTQIQFPCPTLVRKNKCSSVQTMASVEEDSFYEELKPRNLNQEPVAVVDDVEVGWEAIGPEDGETDESRPEVHQTTDNEDGGGIYINLQELEQERRRLIAAQCVRAKYAENWIDEEDADAADVEEQSIAGNNRLQTKIYWENQMRKEQKERNMKQAKYWNNNAPSSELIIAKMNAEIEELHRREKELKKMKTEAEDDEDVFSSGTSSVDDFENSDSPRLESGFYSNVGEDESIPSPELSKEALTMSVNDNRSFIESPLTVEVEVSTFSPETQRSEEIVTEAFSILNESNEPESEPETPPPTYTFQKETPIEREIRLARERENEYKMRRISSSTSNLTTTSGNEFASLPASPTTPNLTKEVKPAARRSLSISASAAEEKVAVSSKPSDARDIQYRMATERLKKEIQEAKEREDELKSRELKSVQITSPKSYVPSYVASPVKEVVNRFEVVEAEKRKHKFSLSNSIDDSSPVVNGSERKDSLKAEPIAVHGFTPIAADNDVQETRPAVPEPTVYNTITRPKFNSIERYLLKSSVKLRIGKNFQLPAPATIIEAEPVVTEEKQEEEVEEPITPRKRLVRAQDKINQELLEMKEREKEFALRRTFKSTPDLTQDNNANNAIEEENDNGTAVVRPDKNVALEPRDRRRSALINQWEEKIQGGN